MICPTCKQPMPLDYDRMDQPRAPRGVMFCRGCGTETGGQDLCPYCELPSADNPACEADR